MPKTKSSHVVRKVALFFYRDTITQAQVHAVEEHFKDFVVGFRRRIDRRDITENADVYAGDVPAIYRTRADYALRVYTLPIADIYSGETEYTPQTQATVKAVVAGADVTANVDTKAGVQGTVASAVAPTDAPKAPAAPAPAPAPVAPAAPKAPTAP